MFRRRCKIDTKRGLSSWSISFGIHFLILVVLSLLTLSKPVVKALVLYAGFDHVEGTQELLPLTMENPQIGLPDGEDVIEMSAFSLEVSKTPVVTVELSSFQTTDGASENNTAFFKPSQLMQGLNAARAQPIGEALNGRTGPLKSKLLGQYGGNAESEAAVQRALRWLANHQANDGGWSFEHSQVCNGQCDSPGRFANARNGATAIALLPFLGAGHTHKQGDYQKTVDDGLRFLIAHMNKADENKELAGFNGSWFEPQGTMYSHCLATIALSEAYAMTEDPALRAPAQSGVDFLVRSQNRSDGGWRYSPGAPGDTSVVGWAMMALKSARIGGLDVPDATIENVSRFLTQVSSNHGSRYGYMRPDKNPHGLAATSAIGLLCRMYGGWPRSQRGLKLGVDSLLKIGPDVEHAYYTYYASQVLHHFGGEEWKQWNGKLRDAIVNKQIKEGHAAGSWLPNQELDGMAGGRLYTTAMMTMTLEVYYRHMPLYTESVLDDDFPL